MSKSEWKHFDQTSATQAVPEFLYICWSIFDFTSPGAFSGVKHAGCKSPNYSLNTQEIVISRQKVVEAT